MVTGMDLDDLRKRALQVNRHGGGSGYWAGKVLALVDLINDEREAERVRRIEAELARLGVPINYTPGQTVTISKARAQWAPVRPDAPTDTTNDARTP